MKKFLTSVSLALVLLSALSLTGCHKEDISKMPEYAVATVSTDVSGNNYIYLFYSDRQVSDGSSETSIKLSTPFIRIGFPAFPDGKEFLGDWTIVKGTPSSEGKREVDVYDTSEGWIKGGTVSITVNSLEIDGKTKNGARYMVTHSGLIPVMDVEE